MPLALWCIIIVELMGLLEAALYGMTQFVQLAQCFQQVVQNFQQQFFLFPT